MLPVDKIQGILGSLTSAYAMRGLTWSPRAYRFGRIPPYHKHWLIYQKQSSVEDVLRSIDVPVVDSSTDRACPFSHGEVFRSEPLCATYGTKLTGRIEAAYRDHLFPIPVGFVDELPTELAPACIENSLSEFMVLHHILRGKILNADDTVLVN